MTKKLMRVMMITVRVKRRRRQRSCVQTGLTGCRCLLWRRRAACRYVRFPRGATDKQKVQEGRGSSGKRSRSSPQRRRGRTTWSPHYRLQTKGKRGNIKDNLSPNIYNLHQPFIDYRSSPHQWKSLKQRRMAGTCLLSRSSAGGQLQ